MKLLPPFSTPHRPLGYPLQLLLRSTCRSPLALSRVLSSLTNRTRLVVPVGRPIVRSAMHTRPLEYLTSPWLLVDSSLTNRGGNYILHVFLGYYLRPPFSLTGNALCSPLRTITPLCCFERAALVCRLLAVTATNLSDAVVLLPFLFLPSTSPSPRS